MKVLIGTKNPLKIQGATEALELFFENFEIEGVNVSSDVSEQPVNDEVLKGAENRVKNLVKYAEDNNINADLYMAIEAGISNDLGRWCNYNISFVQDKDGNIGWGCGPAFPIPEKYVKQIENSSLSAVFDSIFNKENSGKTQGGGVRCLTKNAITRQHITKEAFIMALTTIINDFWRG